MLSISSVGTPYIFTQSGERNRSSLVVDFPKRPASAVSFQDSLTLKYYPCLPSIPKSSLTVKRAKLTSLLDLENHPNLLRENCFFDSVTRCSKYLGGGNATLVVLTPIAHLLVNKV